MEHRPARLSLVAGADGKWYPSIERDMVEMLPTAGNVNQSLDEMKLILERWMERNNPPTGEAETFVCDRCHEQIRYEQPYTPQSKKLNLDGTPHQHWVGGKPDVKA